MLPNIASARISTAPLTGPISPVFDWLWSSPASCASINETCKNWHHLVHAKAPNLYPRGRAFAYERFKSVQRLHFSERTHHLTSRELAHAVQATMRTLVEVHLSDTCSGIVVAPLQDCVHLRRLTLSRTIVKDGALASLLRHLPDLRHLEIVHCHSLRGAFMTSLDACPLLTFLAVQDCESHITEAGLQAVARLSHLAALKLETYSLPYSPISFKAMLEHLGSLRLFSMNTTWSFSNEHLQCLADSPCAPFLEELDLSRTSIATGTDSNAWAILLSFPSLRRLRLANCRLDANRRGAAAIAALLRHLDLLEELDICHTPELSAKALRLVLAASGAGLRALTLELPAGRLTRLPPPPRVLALRTLRLRAPGVDAASVLPILHACAPSLVHLDASFALADCTVSTDAVAATLGALRGLHELSLRDCAGLRKGHLASLGTLTDLRQLEVHAELRAGKPPGELAGLGRLQALESLRLQGLRPDPADLPDLRGLRALCLDTREDARWMRRAAAVGPCPQVRSLALVGRVQLGQLGWAVEAFPGLQRVDVICNGTVPNLELLALQELPRLHCLSVRSAGGNASLSLGWVWEVFPALERLNSRWRGEVFHEEEVESWVLHRYRALLKRRLGAPL
ncbi:hypothetical protein ACKKBF_B36385 [Auxenochlorella protothecoides x Auxenochlorella symbiontica]